MEVTQRFLKYVSFDTTSSETSDTVPTTDHQKVLGRYLAQELAELGLEGAHMDDKGYVYALLPATPGCQAPALGLIAHMDTSPAVSGADIHPEIVTYQGGDLPLKKAGSLKVKDFPFLERYIGQELIVTDGTTLLGADDKAGVAEIVTACLEQGDSSGILRSYHLRYLRADGPLYTRIAFTDAAQEDATLRAVVKMCLIVGVAALAVLLGCSYLLAGLAARPVARSLDQQRRFLSDASHELKTPLTVILSSADLMQQTAVQPDQQPYVDNIRWSGRRMKRLVEDMLTLSRADDGRLKAAMVPVDLSDAVVDTALRFEPVAFEAGRQLSYDIDEGITVTGSRDQLQQVAGVLLDNAIKYAPQGAGVHMTLTQAERKAALTVENGGPPIPPEVLPHLFDRFYRADGSRTQGGFGLGLSIAQAIVREHKGTIRCESDRRSTRFIVTLPAGGKK